MNELLGATVSEGVEPKPATGSVLLEEGSVLALPRVHLAGVYDAVASVSRRWAKPTGAWGMHGVPENFESECKPDRIKEQGCGNSQCERWEKLCSHGSLVAPNA